jgi:hypothetical protein
MVKKLENANIASAQSSSGPGRKAKSSKKMDGYNHQEKAERHKTI